MAGPLQRVHSNTARSDHDDDVAGGHAADVDGGTPPVARRSSHGMPDSSGSGRDLDR